MATAQLPAGRQQWARAPFQFNSAAHLLRLTAYRAVNLDGLLAGLRAAPDEAIFQHTFHTLQEHHYAREAFSNDFAHWVFTACNEVALAERLATVDVREYTSIKNLRDQFVGMVADYLRTHPRAAERAALEPFHFCATDTVVIPTSLEANNLEQFVDTLQQASAHSIHYHFIDARLRLKLRSNDFSVWLEKDMGMPELADRVNRIDIYTSTLNDIRRKIMRVIDGASA